jgi:hypothetical protein
MAFSSSLKYKEFDGMGNVTEVYTFDGTGVTTGTITAQSSKPSIVEILSATASSNGDTAVTCALDGNRNDVKLTFSSGDAGTCTIKGRCA